MRKEEKDEQRIINFADNFGFRSVAFVEYLRESPEQRDKLIAILDHFEQWKQAELHPKFRKKQGDKDHA